MTAKSKEDKIRSILVDVIGENNVQAWLDAPHPDLGNRSPQSVRDEYGDAGVDAVLDMLEAALGGQPS